MLSRINNIRIVIVLIIVGCLYSNLLSTKAFDKDLFVDQRRSAASNQPSSQISKQSFSPQVLEKLSAPVCQYLSEQHLLEQSQKQIQTSSKNNLSKPLANSHAPQNLTGNVPNIMINDPNFQDTLRTESQTASAAFQDNIVVVYNKTGPLRTETSYSYDGGATWQESSVTSIQGGNNLGNSAIGVDTEGTFYVATVAANRANLTTIAVSRSQDGGASWFNAVDVIGADVKSRFIYDRPWIAIDNRNKAQKNVYVSWTRFDDTDKRSSIMFARSTNGGIRFSTPIEITPNTKGFNVDGSRLAIGLAGEIYLSWVDNQTGTIFLAKSTNGGTSFSQALSVITLGDLRTPSLLNGSFRTNSVPSLAVDTSNTKTQNFVYFAYNGRTSVDSPDKSDIFLLRSTNGGQSWEKPLKVNDDQTVTDQWMPSVTVTNSGKVALLWYDRRNNPVNDSLIDVYAATSFDGGQSINSNLRVTDTSWPLVPTPTAIAFGYHGEYNQISAQGDFINLHWADDRSGTDPDIYFAKMAVDDLQQTDFSLSGRTIFASARPNETATFLGESLRVGAFNDFIELSATTNLKDATIQFSDIEILAGNGFNLNVLVPANAKAGNYTITVTGSSKDRSRSTLLRLSVLSADPEAKIPSNLTRSSGESTRPKIITDSQGIFHLVWQDDTDGVPAIFYANSLDGKEFSTPINLSRSFNPSIKPIIASDKQGSIHIIWEEPNSLGSFLVYTRTDDLGKSFLPKRIITSDIPSSFNPKLAIEANGTIDLVWSAMLSSGSAILFSQSKDRGENFNSPKVVTSTDRVAFYEPILTIDPSNTLHLAYTAEETISQRFDTPTFIAGLFYQRSVDENQNFSEPINLIPRDFILADSPILLADKLGRISLIFSGFNKQQPLASREIYFAQSFDNGASFFTFPNTISQGNGDSTAIAASYSPDGTLTVLWRDTQRRNFDIFISRLLAGELEFIGPTNISQDLGISDFPTLAVNNQGNMLVAWADDSIGNSEIFFYSLTPDDLPNVKLDNFSPTIANSGDMITIKGKNFSNVLEVRVGQLSAKFNIISNEELQLQVPVGAVAGVISVFSVTGQSAFSLPLMIKGQLGLQPTFIDFGKVLLDQKVTKSFQLVNNSNSPKTVSRILFNSRQFSLGNIKTPITIAANSSLEIPVMFAPTVLTLQGALATVSVDSDSTSLFVELLGIGLDSRPPQVSTIMPNGGEIFSPGQQVKITWQAQDNTAIATQEIQLSLDGGKTFPITVASGLTKVREFLWTVPEVDTTMSRIRIVAKDLSGNLGQGVTPKDFTIKKKRK